MSLFDTEEFAVCQKCGGIGYVYNAKVDATRACSCQEPPPSPPTPKFDAQRAAELGEEGMAKALRAERVQAWRAVADEWVVAVPSGITFSADNVVSAVGLPDLPDQGQDRNNVLGGWFNSKARLGLIVWTGAFTKSERPERHGNLQRVWRKV